MRYLTKEHLLVLVVGLASVVAVPLFGLWKAKAERHGQEPAEPFRIAGNFYYVGANDASSFLITGPEGHVLLGSGYPANAPMIMASIAKLGFDIKHVRVLLNSEPHSAGALAALQQASGAQLWASEASARVIASGGDDPDIALPLRTLVQIGILGQVPQVRRQRHRKEPSGPVHRPRGGSHLHRRRRGGIPRRCRALAVAAALESVT